jgi:hypothetical protein
MKRRFTIAAIAASIVSLAMMSSGISAESAHEGDTEKAGETVAETEADTAEFDAVAFLEAIKGTYEPLFPIIRILSMTSYGLIPVFQPWVKKLALKRLKC